MHHEESEMFGMILYKCVCTVNSDVDETIAKFDTLFICGAVRYKFFSGNFQDLRWQP